MRVKLNCITLHYSILIGLWCRSSVPPTFLESETWIMVSSTGPPLDKHSLESWKCGRDWEEINKASTSRARREIKKRSITHKDLILAIPMLPWMYVIIYMSLQNNPSWYLLCVPKIILIPKAKGQSKCIPTQSFEGPLHLIAFHTLIRTNHSTYV